MVDGYELRKIRLHNEQSGHCWSVTTESGEDHETLSVCLRQDVSISHTLDTIKGHAYFDFMIDFYCDCGPVISSIAYERHWAYRLMYEPYN